MIGFFFRTLFFIADFALVAACAAGLAAGRLHPDAFWWAGFPATFLPFLGLALTAALPLVLVFLPKRRVLTALHVIVLALVFLRFQDGLRRSLRDGPAPADDDLTLMTINVPRYPENEAANRATTALVAAVDPDAIAIQESHIWASADAPTRLRGHVKFSTVIDSLAYRSPIPTIGPAHGRWTRWRMPFVTRFPIDDQEEFELHHPTIPSDVAYFTRTAFRWQGRPAVHYNLHLYTYGERKPWRDDTEIRWFDPDYWQPYVRTARESYHVRAWQAEQIRARIERETLPVVISGDFNATRHNWAYRHIARGFQDVFVEQGEGWGATYHSERPLVRIDHILVGPEWEVVHAYVPPSTEIISDHRALVGRIRWGDADED